MSRAFRLLAALTLLARTAMGQDRPTAPLVLRLPGGARAMGLGNAFVAGRTPEVLFYNPAQLFNGRGTTISVQRFRSSATLATLATVGPFGKLAIGAGVQYLDYESPVTSEFYIRPALLPGGGPLQSASLAATLAAAFRFKGIRFGAAGKYVQERVGGLPDGSFALDAGAAREFGRATVGLAVQNLGSGIEILDERADLPTRITLGVASPTIRFGTYFDLVAAATVSRERDGRIVPGTGVEVFYAPVDGWNFAGRVGARRVDGGPKPHESPVTVGGSFGFDRVWIDYVFQPSAGGGATYRVGLRIQ